MPKSTDKADAERRDIRNAALSTGAIVFAGPSIYGMDKSAWPEVRFAPPVEAGDVVRAVRDGARVIGIIDGYFETTRSVWHKEILWALSQGVTVLGAASMGALRAAELADLGMRGVGWVFEQYYRGMLEDDDEVTLLHGPPETGYMPLTEALVNIRYGLHSACEKGVIDEAQQNAILSAARGLNYKERTRDMIAQSLAGNETFVSGYETFCDYIDENELDRKRDDAAEMLDLMREQLACGEGAQLAVSLNMTEQLAALLDEVGAH